VFGGEDRDVVCDETVFERQREKELMESGALADSGDLPVRNWARVGDDHEQPLEAFRFTIADNLGLVEDVWGDVLIVRSSICFCGGREERGGELLGF
jgi:GTP-binding protein